MCTWRQLRFLLVSCFLAGCAHVPESRVSLDGSQITDLTKVALIEEDKSHPALLRGLDGVELDSMRIPNAFGQYVYVVSAGRHALWVTDMPYGHPLIPQRRRCYTIRADLSKGVRYRLKEDANMKKALLVRTDTGETVSTGELVDEPWVFSRPCKWQ